MQKSFSNKRPQYFDSDNNNFRVIEALGLTSEWDSEPIVIMDNNFNLQINIQGSSSFDIALQQSIDGEFWGNFEINGVDSTSKTNVGSGDAPFMYQACGARFRFIRVIMRNIVGTANVEVYKI